MRATAATKAPRNFTILLNSVHDRTVPAILSLFKKMSPGLTAE